MKVRLFIKRRRGKRDCGKNQFWNTERELGEEVGTRDKVSGTYSCIEVFDLFCEQVLEMKPWGWTVRLSGGTCFNWRHQKRYQSTLHFLTCQTPEDLSSSQKQQVLTDWPFTLLHDRFCNGWNSSSRKGRKDVCMSSERKYVRVDADNKARLNVQWKRRRKWPNS